MPVAQSVETARDEHIGAEGVATAALNEALGRSAEALDWLRARHADGSLPLLRLPAARYDLAAIFAFDAFSATNRKSTSPENAIECGRHDPHYRPHQH